MKDSLAITAQAIPFFLLLLTFVLLLCTAKIILFGHIAKKNGRTSQRIRFKT